MFFPPSFHPLPVLHSTCGGNKISSENLLQLGPWFGLFYFYLFILAQSFFSSCFCLEDTLKALKEKSKQSEAPEPEPEPEPTTEVLFLCSYEGCGKTFIDAGALRKHSHIHGERQYVCHYEGCGKVLSSFSDLLELN